MELQEINVTGACSHRARAPLALLVPPKVTPQRFPCPEEHFRQSEAFEHNGSVGQLCAFARSGRLHLGTWCTPRRPPRSSSSTRRFSLPTAVGTKKNFISAGKHADEPGTPRLIVLCSTAVRCTEIVKALRGCQVEKRPVGGLVRSQSEGSRAGGLDAAGQDPETTCSRAVLALMLTQSLLPHSSPLSRLPSSLPST